MKRKTAFLGVLLALGGCGLLREERVAEAPPEPPVARSLHTFPVELTDLLETVDGYATATPVRQTSLYFIEGGRLRTLNVEAQDEVKEGQILAQLEIEDLQHRHELAQIDVELARVRLEKAKAVGSVFDEQGEELALRRAHADLRYLERRVAAATIRAPHDGVIYRVQIKPSDLVVEYDPVIDILDPTELELRMRVTEEDFIRIRPGIRARVETGRGQWVEATVTQATHKNPRLDATVRRDEYLAHLATAEPLPDLELYEGMSAQGIIGESEQTLVIPRSALREFRGRTYVRVLDGETRYEVDVRTGIETQTHVEILDGLKQGDLVISR